MAPGHGVLRLVRAAVFAVSAVGLACAAHLAGGEPFPVPVALLCVPFVMLVIHLVAGRRRGPLGLLAGMGLTQVGLHLTLMTSSVTTTAGSCAAPGSMDAMPAGHAHAGAQCAQALAQTGPAGLMPSMSMILAHTIATLAVVLLLARGEAAVWALAACLHFRFRLPAVVALPPAVLRLPVAGGAGLLAPRAVHLRSIRRRGPPARACAVA